MTSFPANASTHPDAWPATDALGRTVSTAETTGPPRKDKFVGAFYFLWLGEHGRGGPYDISKILAKDPSAINDPKNPLWGPQLAYHHWGEPLFGYYLSGDPWVLRKHAQMLFDAGVDTVIFDVTNQTTYPNNYLALCKVWSQVRKEGGATPQIAFLTPFWDPRNVVRTLYDDFYSKDLYKDLWFQWKGKPLILADPAKVDEDTKGFFTFRKPQPSYFEGPTGPDQWSWLEVYPQHEFYNSAGKPEQMTVGIGQNGILPDRCAAFTEKGTHGRSWHNGAEDTTPGAVNLGLNVTEQWERALKVDPEFIFITSWNEWIAMNLPEFNGVSKPPMFVDQFTQEYSRDIEPMRGGHADAYYYQMIDYIRRFKGANPIPKASAPKTITINGKFDDWANVGPEYRDDLRHRAPRPSRLEPRHPLHQHHRPQRFRRAQGFARYQLHLLLRPHPRADHPAHRQELDAAVHKHRPRPQYWLVWLQLRGQPHRARQLARDAREMELPPRCGEGWGRGLRTPGTPKAASATLSKAANSNSPSHARHSVSATPPNPSASTSSGRIISRASTRSSSPSTAIPPPTAVSHIDTRSKRIG